MDRRARRFVKMRSLPFEDLIREPAKEHDRRNRGCQAKQEREADELEQTLFVCRHGPAVAIVSTPCPPLDQGESSSKPSEAPQS